MSSACRCKTCAIAHLRKFQKKRYNWLFLLQYQIHTYRSTDAAQKQLEISIVLEAYRKHIDERAAEGVVPQPLSPEQTAELVELLKNPPAGEEEFILDLLVNRVPAGVDQAAYVKAGFLAAISKGRSQFSAHRQNPRYRTSRYHAGWLQHRAIS